MAAATAAAALTALTALLPLACLRLQPPTVPMRSLALAVSQPPHHRLVVLLEGRGGSPENFAYANFAALSIAGRLPADLIAADARLSYFYRGNLVERLHQDVIAPALARGYDQVFLAGVSLGCATALLYYAEHPQAVSGILLLSPFLGRGEVVREVERAGGLARWQPPATLPPLDFPRREWEILKGMTGGGGGAAGAGAATVPLYLAYGDHDHFLAADRLLAAALPPGRVLVVPGHHDWPTWRTLWTRFLASGALDEPGGGVAAAAQR